MVFEIEAVMFETLGPAAMVFEIEAVVFEIVARRLVIEDDFDWALPDENGEDEGKEEVLRYVGGVDVSFSKEDSTFACACIVVLDVEAVEVPVPLGLLQKMKTDSNPFYPQLLMVDGNGLLHPRG
ncbi:hypothetical protein Drorol1_Dr00017913, partial [Drosera rotundifolia]